LKRNHLVFLLKVAISTILILYLFKKELGGLYQVKSALFSADSSLVLFAASFHLSGYLLSAMRWRFLLHSQKVQIDLGALVMSHLVSIFFSSFLPGTVSGDVVRGLDTAAKVGSIAKSMLVVFVDRLIGVIALFMLSAASLGMAGADVLSNSHMSLLLISLAVLSIAVIVMIFHPSNVHLVNWIIRAIPFSSVRSKCQNVTELLQMFSGQYRVLYISILISLLFQVNVVLHYVVLGTALNIEIPWINYFVIIPASILILMIPVSINGIGIREYVFIFLFAKFGVPAALSISLAWIAFGIGLAQALIGGIVFVIRKRSYVRNV